MENGPKSASGRLNGRAGLYCQKLARFVRRKALNFSLNIHLKNEPVGETLGFSYLGYTHSQVRYCITCQWAYPASTRLAGEIG